MAAKKMSVSASKKMPAKATVRKSVTRTTRSSAKPMPGKRNKGKGRSVPSNPRNAGRKKGSY